MESTELMTRGNMIQTVDDLSRIGKMMAISGYFQDARDAAQAAVKVQAGLEMGFGPFASMTGIHIIQGRPAVGANLIASAIKASPKYDYRVRKLDDTVAELEFFEIVGGKRESIGISTFTAADAKRANVKNMTAYPRNMLFARAISNGVRWFCPDVFSGTPTYTPEELGAEVDEQGAVIEIPQAQPVVEEVPVASVSPAPKAAEFDEDTFLGKFPGVPEEYYEPIEPEDAEKVLDSDGIPYGMIPTQELRYRLNNLYSSLRKNHLEPDEAAAKRQKLGVINAILLDRKAHPEKRCTYSK